MSGFIKGENRYQATLFPEQLDDYITEDNSVRVIDVFVDSLKLKKLGFKSKPTNKGRPGYDPALMLKLYVYGYLNRVQLSRRLEREAQRNVELMWLLGRLAPDFKTIADFRKDNGSAIKKVCSEFVQLCKRLELFCDKEVAIDGSKFKAVNNADRAFSKAKIKRRIEAIDKSIDRYLEGIKKADRLATKESKNTKIHLKERLAKVKKEAKRLELLENELLQTPDKQLSLTDPDSRIMATRGRSSVMVGYNVQSAVDTKNHLILTHEVTNFASNPVCAACSKKSLCTKGVHRRIRRWEHEYVVDELDKRMANEPHRMGTRRSTVEHPFGTIKSWMGHTHFQTKTMSRVATEMSLHVLSYNLKRVISILGVQNLITAMEA